MVKQHRSGQGGSRLGPIVLAGLTALAAAGPASAQTGGAQVGLPQAPSAAVLPDQAEAARLVWTVMVAVEQANGTGNFTVLRDLGAPGFQTNNTPASLANIFAGVRSSGIDLSRTLLVQPSYEFAPRMVQGGMLRLRGSFPMRPTALRFDLLFQPVGGRWRLNGISLLPVAGGIQAEAPSRSEKR